MPTLSQLFEKVYAADLHLDYVNKLVSIKNLGNIECVKSLEKIPEDSLDCIIAADVLEHVDNPEKIYSELRRVARHGYIQSPSWYGEEIMYGEHVHKWVMLIRNKKLYYRTVWKTLQPFLPFDYVFHRLYKRFFFWRLVHAILDELLNIFTIRYKF